jgi:DNA-binding GntR family transcriptional regulator
LLSTKETTLDLHFSIDNSLTIRDQIYHFVRQLIMNGHFSPNDRIVEAQLAKKLNISRTPVREVLHSLEREGLLGSTPRVGYQLRRMTRKEVEEICEIRIVNETLGAKWAIERITPELVPMLEENIRTSEEEARKGNPRKFVKLDGSFHEIIQKASGSERLYEYCKLLRDSMMLCRVNSIYTSETVLEALKGHWSILNCIRHCAYNEIGRAIREHLNYAKQNILKVAFPED